MRHTNDVQHDESLCSAVLVPDHHLVLALILFAGALQPVLALINRCVNVLHRQAGVSKKPLGLSARVGIVGYVHDEGLPSVCHQFLVCGFDLRNRCRGRRCVLSEFLSEFSATCKFCSAQGDGPTCQLQLGSGILVLGNNPVLSLVSRSDLTDL